MEMGAEFWLAHVAALKLLQLPASEYARQHNISVKALYYWRSKLQGVSETAQATQPVKSAQASRFVALQVADRGVDQHFHCALLLPSSIRLEMSGLPSPEWLAACAIPFTKGVR